MWEPELFRIYGELCRCAPERMPWSRASAFSELMSAEAAIQRAIDTARQRGARSQELGAALNLARLWTSRGQREHALLLLGPIYVVFTEGHDTGDFVQARRLLGELHAA